MVDTREIPTGTIEDKSTALAALALDNTADLEQYAFNYATLKICLENDNLSVKIWAAEALSKLWPQSVADIVPALIEGDDEAKEMGIRLIMQHNLTHYGFTLLRLFSGDNVAVRHLAAEALAKFDYKQSTRALLNWYKEILSGHKFEAKDLTVVAQSLMAIEPVLYTKEIFNSLLDSVDNPRNFLALFEALSSEIDDAAASEKLSRIYGVARENFYSNQLIKIWMNSLRRDNTLRYLEAQFQTRKPSVVYAECLELMGFNIGEQLEHFLQSMHDNNSRNSDIAEETLVVSSLLDIICDRKEQLPQISGFIAGCWSWLNDFDRAQSSVRQNERLLLLSMPVAAALDIVERQCLADPIGNASRIARIYHSPLLSDDFMLKILGLLSNNPEPYSVNETLSKSWLRDREKDALWRIASGQLQNDSYPYDQVIPEPWKYNTPQIMQFLNKTLAGSFNNYISAQRRSIIDYSLAVFMRNLAQPQVELVLQNFEHLIHEHFYALVEYIGNVPDRRFLGKIYTYYHSGEFELMQLIAFICEVNSINIPRVIKEELDIASGGLRSRQRCLDCSSCFTYNIDKLYINIDKIEQRQPLEQKDLWYDGHLSCKECGSSIDFNADINFIRNLFDEVLSVRMNNPMSTQISEQIMLLRFPMVQGRVFNPKDFIRWVRLEGVLTTEARLELGRLELSRGRLDEAENSFLALTENHISLYYLGIISYRCKQYNDALNYFREFCRLESNLKEPESEAMISAQDHIELISNELSRRRLRLI